MVFSSAIFLLAFLPVVFVSNLITKKEYSNILLLIASLIFYAWGEPFLVFLMILSIVVNYLIGRFISRSDKITSKRAWLIAGVILDLLFLGYYKYYGFLVTIINGIAGKELIPDPGIALPIGISFFTFQAISYIADVYKGEVEASPSIINTALYISFFPQLIAGPIVKYRDINEQIEDRTITKTGIAHGFKRFIYGLSKKVLISNVLGLCADIVYTTDLNLIDCKAVWIGTLAYTFQIYYDFSGYSDMAIGLGEMFGFRIPENFDYPYLSRSISEYWRRWHISLGTWFKEYVYIPLGGNRKGKFRTYLNLILVFFLTGLWHGAAYSYVIWGLYHGLFAMIERLGLKKLLDRSKILSTLYCFLVVNFGFVIFRAEDIAKGFTMLSRMFMPGGATQPALNLWRYVDLKTVFIFICAVAGAGIVQKLAPKKLAEAWKGSVYEAVYCVILLVLSIASITANTYNPFIYFQF